MLANAKIINGNNVNYMYFQSVDDMVAWMKKHHGQYNCVETDFLNPWNVEPKKERHAYYEELRQFTIKHSV